MSRGVTAEVLIVMGTADRLQESPTAPATAAAILAWVRGLS